MATYKDFKSYIQAHYENELRSAVQGYVNRTFDGNAFHSNGPLSLCNSRVENVSVKALSCRTEMANIIDIAIHVSADVVTLGLGKKEYEAGRKNKWFTVSMEARLNDGLQDIRIYDTREYSPSKFDKDTTLDEFLLPYIYAKDLEDEADDFFKFYCQNAIYDRWVFPVSYVLGEMGIEYYEAPLPEGLFGAMYFYPSMADHYTFAYPGIPPRLVKEQIKSGTMLISDKEYFMHDVGSKLTTIAHEIIHWDKHELFFEILHLLDEDEDRLSCGVAPEVSPEGLEGARKALWWAEWQANALAPRILMPRVLFLPLWEQIFEEKRGTPHFHRADVYEDTVKTIADCFGVSKYAAKVRALQLGIKEAEGAFLHAGGSYHPPFTFNPIALGGYQTFIVDRKNYEKLLEQDDYFAGLIESGDFVYTGCVVCINSPAYIKKANSPWPEIEYELTAYATDHVDECCLRFTREYYPNSKTGDFYNLCYLSKDVNSEQFREIKTITREDNQDVSERANELRKINDATISIANALNALPRGFAETLDWHITNSTKEDGRKMTNEELSMRTGISKDHIGSLRTGKKSKPEFATVCALCIGLHLQPWFSEDLIMKSDHIIQYRYTPEGLFAWNLLTNHRDEALELINMKLKEYNYPLWGKPENIIS